MRSQLVSLDLPLCPVTLVFLACFFQFSLSKIHRVFRTMRNRALGSCYHFNPRLQFTEALAKGERFCVSLRCLTGPLLTCTVQYCLDTVQRLHLKKKVHYLRYITSSSSYSPTLAARNSNKSIMNIKEQPCLQVFWPQAPSSHPITSSQVLRSGLHPPLMHFQPHRIMIQRKRFLHLPCFFYFFPPAALQALQREASFATPMLQKGKAQCRRQRLVENHRPQAGRWPTRPCCFQQSMCLCS